MKTTLKRLTALILALSMALSLFSTGAWAAELSAESSDESAVSSAEPEEGEAEEAAPEEDEAEEAAPEEAEAEAPAPEEGSNEEGKDSAESATEPKEEGLEWEKSATNASEITVSTQEESNSDVVTFAYTGDVQTFTAPADGYYKLEAWGAQGGTTSKGKSGGKGGYSTGVIYLTKDTTLSVYVGGAGGATDGGWNGGGKGVVGKNRSATAARTQRRRRHRLSGFGRHAVPPCAGSWRRRRCCSVLHRLSEWPV